MMSGQWDVVVIFVVFLVFIGFLLWCYPPE